MRLKFELGGMRKTFGFERSLFSGYLFTLGLNADEVLFDDILESFTAVIPVYEIDFVGKV